MNKTLDILGDESSYTSMSPKEKEYFIQLLREEIDKREADARFEQIRDILPIDKWISSPYHVGPDYDRIYQYWKDVIVDIFDENRTPENKINLLILSGCFTGDTKVSLLDGRELSFEELVNEFGMDKPFWVYSCDSRGNIRPGRAHSVRKTKIHQQIFCVELDNGEIIRCTPDHKFMLRDGSYVQAQDLKEGQTLMSRDGNQGVVRTYMSDTYEDVYDLEVDKYHNFALSSGVFVHNSIGIGKSCLSETTRIPTSLGLLPLKTLYKEFHENRKRFKVLSESGIKDCIDVYDNGIDDTKIITFESGRVVEGTEKHKLRVIVGDNSRVEWVKFGDLKIGDKTLMTQYITPYGTLVVKPFEAYLLGLNVLKEGIDNRVYKMCKESMGDFLQGVIDISNHHVLESHDKDLLRELGYILSNQGFDFSLVESENNIYTLSFNKVNDSYLDTIVSISDGRCHTYDLTIDEDHSYCFNGFISHNTCAELVVLRKLYEMSCYRNINAMYNLMRQASIMFFYFSVNKTQAERTGFGAIRNLIDSVPYFNEYFKRRDKIDSLLVFPENIQIAFGSGSNDMIGMNSITSILDEANFIGGRDVGNVEKASALFTSIVNRSNSRFIINGGENHSLNILVSSATTENSVTELVIGQNRDNPHTYICAPAQWEVKPDKFSKKYFFVCKGTERLEPHVVHSTDDINNFRLSEGLPKEKCVDNLREYDEIRTEIEKLPPHFQSKFLRVPEDLRTGFETNIIRSLQDLGGVSTGSTGKLFTSVQVFNDCIDSERFQHPFVSNEIVVSTGDKIEIREYLKASFRLRHPERPRFIHIDQSYRTDSTGIACVYVDDVISDETTGVKKPIIGVDFMLRINPPSPPRKIAIYKIRNFIVWLGTSFGMKLGKVTYDIFNSEESRQILEEMGFNVGYQSVDRTDKAYLDLVEIMYEGRLKMYDYPILRYELFNLIHYRDKRKVDHPKLVSSDASIQASSNGSGYSGKGSGIGSKDTSDALCGAVENLLQQSIAEEAGDYINNIEDFLYANSFNRGFEPDSLSAEDLIDRQIDNFIEEMEFGGDPTTGFLNGTQTLW